MAVIQQADRLLSVATPLGEDKLLLAGFTGGEALSRLFSYQLDLLSEDEEIDPSAIVGKNITWRVQYQNGEPRFFNGYVSRFAASSVLLHKLRVYRAEVVPWLWFLTRTSDCRIWAKADDAKSGKTVPEIIDLVFQEFGFASACEKRLSAKRVYRKREYCVQYRETAFNFVSRLMEEEGIFYYFRHDDGVHKLVLADNNGAYADCPEKEVEYGSTRRGPGIVTTWDHQFSFRSGKWAQTDYNFETPSTNLLTNTDTLVPQPGEDAYELFDYPGNYLVTADGKTLTDIRMEEEEAPYEVVSGSGGCTTFSPGAKFTLTKHDVAEEEGNTYVLTAVQHVAKEFGFYSSTRGGEYSNSFSCIRSAVTFRPARLTIKPTVQGPQPAVVVGPTGEEIYTDKYGRIKVQFFWDREGTDDEKSTCWMRVAQIWAGKRWGASFWPRIGHEVIVDFLEGDPDRPIVVGSVYNAENMPHYELPKYRTVASIVSNTTPGSKGFNELRFEDKKGKEQVFIHSQKRMDVRVLGSLYETCHGNRNEVIGLPKGTEPGGNHEVTVGGDNDIHIKGGRFEGVDKAENLTVKGDVVYDFQGNHSTMVKTNSELNAQQITLEAKLKITFKVGSSFIVIEPSGVTIVGPMVMINSGGSATGTGDPGIDDPADAATSDTGEPGYLDRPRPPGGGGRHHRTLHSQHGINIYKSKPSLRDILNDPNVDAELRRAFNESNPNAPNVPRGSPGSTKHEQGGWIVWNKRTGQLETIRVPPGTRDGLGPIVGTRPADNADQEVVGWFHTHPNTAAEGYGSDPSPPDVAYQNSEARVPGIVETHDGRKTIPYP